MSCLTFTSIIHCIHFIFNFILIVCLKASHDLTDVIEVYWPKKMYKILSLIINYNRLETAPKLSSYRALPQLFTEY